MPRDIGKHPGESGIMRVKNGESLPKVENAKWVKWSTGFTVVKVIVGQFGAMVRTRARPELFEKWRDKVGFDIENFLSFRTDNEMDDLGDNVFPINGNVQGDFWFSSLF